MSEAVKTTMGSMKTGPATGAEHIPPGASLLPGGHQAGPSSGIASGIEALLDAVLATPASADAFEKLADALMAYGYAGQGARWRCWALQPPPAGQLRRSIEELRRLLSGTEDAAGSPAEPHFRPIVNSGDPERILGAVQKLLETGDLDKARVFLRTLAHKEHLPPALCNRVGMLEERAGEFRQAEWWYRISLRKIPAQHMVWFPLAKVLLEQQAWDEALAAAEQGLRLSSDHPWGLKLRTKALEATGAVETLTHLASHGGVADEVLSASPQEQASRRRRRLLGRSWPVPPPMPMLERLRLRRLLSTRSPLWAILHGRGAGPLIALGQAELLPENIVVQPLASRDPSGLRDVLKDQVKEIRAEEPLSLLPHLEDIGMLVIQRPHRACLPKRLRNAFERSIPVLAPVGWLRTPSGYSIAHRHSGWELFWPEDSLD